VAFWGMRTVVVEVEIAMNVEDFVEIGTIAKMHGIYGKLRVHL